MKGDGEAHPFLSPNDEFADYETWDNGNLDGSVKKKNEMLEFEYTRSALKNGLKLESSSARTPTSSASSAAPTRTPASPPMEEDNFFGKTTPQEPSPHRLTATFMDNPKTGVKIMDWEVASSGYAAVWATRTRATRSATPWSARKPTPPPARASSCASSAAGISRRPTPIPRKPASIGYSKGVPMGGDLNDAPAGKSPTFLVAAMKDPLSGNLDRIQIIKGWLDARATAGESL